MFGDRGQVGAGEFAQVADAAFAFVERFDDEEAGGVGERLDGEDAGLAGRGHGWCGRVFVWTVTDGRWCRNGSECDGIVTQLGVHYNITARL